MMETWHPLGPVGVISAFNFPVAVWAWNSALAVVCGDPVVWKPSEKTPLTRARLPALLERALRAHRRRAGGLSSVVHRRRRASARRWPTTARVPLSRATGLDAMGRAVGAARRRAVRPLAARARRQQRDDRGAVGRPRSRHARDPVQRRRHGRPALHLAAPADRARVDRRRARRRGSSGAYRSVPIGDPLEAGTLVGPLIDARRVRARCRPRSRRRAREGGEVVAAASACCRRVPTRTTSRPALVRMPAQTADRAARRPSRRSSTCCATPTLDEAIALHNAVPQGLVVVHLHRPTCARPSGSFGGGQRLRHRQRQHRPERRRDRRRLRRREGDRRRPRGRLGRLEAYMRRRPTRSTTRRPAARAGHPL